MTGDAPHQQVVPHVGGDSAGGVPAGMFVHYSVPTEEFPGGIKVVPVRHRVPSVAIGPRILAVACSFKPAATSFVEPAGACEHFLIDEFLEGSARGFAGGEIDGNDNSMNIYNSFTTETLVMCLGHICIDSGFGTLSPVVQDRLL
ncbi:hypothetical protein CYMTET_32895 [Cymbomonas tetramitiformis]|uniref:Uncharacterized protein n=1 Tax=Cymbomonas tetramitiformis TaxID=36881 RepID=A0AAE0FES1_9CHLO|nr:hypothetical protein CYMTET_32895 [Cymbomonas tetramitiformis]